MKNALCFGLLLNLLFISIGNAQSPAPLAGSRPNIILVMTDDQGYAPVGRHGHPWLKTPSMDRLHDQSVRFTRFMASPTCSPTRSAIMAGRHPMRNGITHTILERERMTLAAVTLPQRLTEVGYQTAIFGKWHLGDEEAYQPHHRGFSHALIHGAGGIGQRYDCSCADAPNNQYTDPVLRLNGKFVKTKGFCTDIFFDAAVQWMDQAQQKGQPFFVYLTTNAPHGPYNAKPEDKARFLKMGFGQEQAGFYGMIENIDANLGKLLDYLEAKKLNEKTLVIFLSDNGMTGGGSGNPRKPLGKDADGQELAFFNANMKGLKGSVDEGGVRVPCFMRWDNHLGAPRDEPHVAAHFDLYPTLATLAGADLSNAVMDGRSLLPLLEDAKANWPDRMLFDHAGRWPKGANPDEFQWKTFTVRNQKYRLVGREELFDMESDPSQTKNVAKSHPDVVASMLAAYEDWWKTTRPLMVNEDTPNAATQPFYELYYEQEKTQGVPEMTFGRP